MKEQIKKFAKTPLAAPVAILLAAGVYYLVTAYMSGFCLKAAITPLFLLGILYMFEIKAVKKMLIIGLVASLAFSAVLIAHYTDLYENLDDEVAKSDETVEHNETTLNVLNGTVTPLYGNDETVFTYTLVINVDESTTPVSDVSVAIVQTRLFFANYSNNTMVLTSGENTTSRHYSYTTTLSRPVNGFVFGAIVNGTWIYAAEDDDLQYPLADGPIYSNAWSVVGVMAPIGLVYGFMDFFPIYGLILVMIWWTRKSRKMREEQIAKWEAEKEKKKVAEGKEEVKVPSLAKAMGMEKEETFVCSECGADVPADATVCPKCGEKFD
ncbi:MAG: zinc ribbon domain-containing protein [Thermoplasmata archaeon]